MERQISVTVNVKCEPDEWFIDTVSSSSGDFKMCETDNKTQLELLTHVINDNSLTADQKNSYRQQRILMNYEKKKYRDVLDDMKILEETNDISGSLLIIKLKSAIHEQCRLARLSLMERIHEGRSTEEYDTFFLNLQPDKVYAFMNDRSTIQLRSNLVSNKRKKVP